MEQTMTRVTTLGVRSREFAILSDEENKFWCIETKYIKNGKLTKQFNGITGLRSKSVSEAIELVKKVVELNYLKEHGFSDAETYSKVFGMDLETAKLIFEKA